MAEINLQTTKDIILVDCNRALKNDVNPRLILERMEQCVQSKYFQDWEDWEYNEYPYLKLLQDNRRICGSKATTDSVIKMDWYQLKSGPSDIQKKLMPDTNYKEDLL